MAALMRCSPLLPSLLLALAPVLAQGDTEPPELPAGPRVVFEPAFAAQAAFDRPVFVAYEASDPTGAYVVLQPGHVFRILRDGSSADRRVFLDLSERVFLDHFEEGLLGFQFDPGYAQNGFVWVYWTERTEVREGLQGHGKQVKSNRQSVVSRFAVVAKDGERTVDPASELRVLEVFQPFGNHNGGTIVFGPDGMLYVALGDGGAANDPFGAGQSLATLLGKVLRIDVRRASREQPYVVPTDNPFVGQDGARPEIWCYGLRNPWRIAFDRANGDLWCGDVGQNRLEEVDILVKGGNYGWNFVEGSEVFAARRGGGEAPAGMLPPVAEYPHTDGLSITGGHVYRGTRIPELQGCYVYADFMTLRVWAVRADRAGGKHAVVQLERAPMQVASFAEEPDGELLLTCFLGKAGGVFRMVPAPPAPK
jgi:glucose/arabinose dehydrogenase